MPNHCENFLKIYSEDNDVDTVLKAIAGEEIIDFNRVIPYPENFKKLDDIAREYEEKAKTDTTLSWSGRPKDGYNSGGYEWCVENWGTKWSAYRIELISKDESSVLIKFETAWSPPHPVIAELSRLFPKHDFIHEYYEMGVAYCGSASYSGGKLQQSARSKYYGFRGG